MRSTVRLGQVVKWPFLMAWSKVLLTGLKSVAWYHLFSSGFLLDDRALSAAGCWLIGGWLGLLVKLICLMPDVFDQLPYNTVSSSLTTLMWVVVKVATHPSLQSFPIDLRAPDCRWGNMWYVRATWVKRGYRFISALWVACMMLKSGRMTWGMFLIGCLFLHGVFTLM